MEKQSERTRQSLVHAAASLIANGRVADAGLVNICRAAAVSRGALYHHFHSVAELVGEVHAQARVRVEAVAGEAFEGRAAEAPEKFSTDLGVLLREDQLVRAGIQVGPDGTNGPGRLREEALTWLRERIVASAPEGGDMHCLADLAVVVAAGLESLGHTDDYWWDPKTAEQIWGLLKPLFAVAGWARDQD
ncbi:TetR/AcrR family transcriptional regulator [Streptomyces regalis]|uniref:TetR family transcriptional regulator n=1 Tax=Streptomyces regalis TaxID=68262 RepID=A0A0X3VG20_9ACTN|nr:TetR/AcrR family transcriptional regulator [Streptomyces regalis]KUL43618.1 TetR family transcriptional regulator [Streptomyces regalis]